MNIGQLEGKLLDYWTKRALSYCDWHFALTEFGGFPQDFDCSPMGVAAEVTKLRNEIKRLQGGR